MDFSLTFMQIFFWAVYLIMPLLFLLCLVVIVLGQIVGKIESWSQFDALYWSFITALTVGYGDIRPLKKRSKILSILVALFGIMLAGIFVAITVEAASAAFKRHIVPSVIQSFKSELK
ncbi:MAG: two pore domain potassium channel family protein [Spongiibacteraceae bacterium]|nr:two pore domain potassium channel family protein [Spongiibacteraceae bacterium]